MVEQLPALHSIFGTTGQNDVFRPRRPRTSMDVIVSFEGGIGAHLFVRSCSLSGSPQRERLPDCAPVTPLQCLAGMLQGDGEWGMIV